MWQEVFAGFPQRPTQSKEASQARGEIDGEEEEAEEEGEEWSFMSARSPQSRPVS